MPVRKIPRSYCHVTGVISSTKSTEMIAYESRPERYFIKHASFNPNVKTCEEQPVRIPYVMKNGKYSHYTPDFLVHFQDNLSPSEYWKPLLIEIKPRYKLFKDWSSLHHKFLAARNYAGDHGWEFTIISEKELVTPYMQNIVFLSQFLHYSTTESDKDAILTNLEKFDFCTPDSILSSITSDVEEKKKLLPVMWKLVANFDIWIDLEAPLNMQSLIKRKPIDEETYEYIYSLFSGRIGNARWRALRYYPHS
jgi:hypothetical protein